MRTHTVLPEVILVACVSRLGRLAAAAWEVRVGLRLA